MIGWQELLVVLVIVVLLFGTKKLSSLGSDLGGALKGFKKAMKEDEPTKNIEQTDASIKPSALDAEKTSSSSNSSSNKES